MNGRNKPVGAAAAQVRNGKPPPPSEVRAGE